METPVNREMLFSGPAPASARGVRLDVFLSRVLKDSGVSRAKIQEWIKAGLALVDGEVWNKPNRKLSGGEMLEFSGETPENRVTPKEGELDILYEDGHVVVLHKPAGLTVHPAPGVREDTLVHRLVHRYPGIADMDEWRPGIVHRLDKDTSGLMLCALNEQARLKVSADFAGREVSKVYLALVHGRPEKDEDLIDLPIGRHPTVKTKMAVVPKGGREARSRYRILWASPENEFSLVAVRIYTGRTHQIRVHLKAIGHPIVGDSVYGGKIETEFKRRCPAAGRLAVRQMLHAAFLRLNHPVSGEELVFHCPPPADFRRLPLVLSRQLERVAITGMPGCGKSVFSGILREMGIPVFSADAAVAAEYEPGADGWLLIRGRFGDRFIPDDKSPVDKRALFEAMVESYGLWQEVMDIIHPLVYHRLETFWKENSHRRLAAAEIPLLFEAAGKRGVPADVTVGIRVDPDVRRGWLTSNRGLAPTIADTLESWQWGEEQKLSQCDVVVDNPGTMEGLRSEAERFVRRLRGDRARKCRELEARLEKLYRDAVLQMAD